MASENIPTYKVTIDPAYAENGEDLGIEQIAFTSNPAIKVKGMAFNTQVKPMIFKDELKYRITAPAMIPMEIYRYDDDTKEEYYVSFSEQEIEAIHAKFMLDMRNKDLFNLEHDAEKTVPAYVLEAWIVDNPLSDKAYSTFGIEVPKGTLMVTAQITDKEYYNQLVADNQIGFSIEGYLGMKLKEQLTLNKTNMNKLPDGEHTIDGKVYVVVDGEITEIKELEATMPEKEEEMAEETVVEEETVMAVDPALDAEAVLAIVQPALDEHMNAVVAMIADIQNQLEQYIVTDETEDVVEAVAMSLHEKFSKFNKFYNQK